MEITLNHVTYYVIAVCHLIMTSQVNSQVTTSPPTSKPLLVDLSYRYDANTPTHPLHTRFDLRAVRRGLNKFGIWVELNDFCSSEHTGTHLDAPKHFAKNGRTVDLIPIERLYRVPGVKIDVTSKILGNQNYEISASDLEEWVQKYGQLPDGVVVLFETGWGKRAFNPQAYSGMDDFGKLNFPGLSQSAAEWLVNYGNRSGQSLGVLGVGLDTMSLDVGQSVQFPAHVTLMANDKYGLENLDNLNKLPPRDFTLTMLPMKIGRGSGGPVRIVAEVGGSAYGSGTIRYTNASTAAILVFIISLVFVEALY